MWYPLHQAIHPRYLLFCKVRLADVAPCPREHREEWRWFAKIGRYHVDFVVCEVATTAPLLVVELDDRGHRGRRQATLDAFKDRVLAAAGIPVYRVPAQQAYDPQALSQVIDRLIWQSQRS